MKIYVVTKGIYSDYHLCGIYSTPEMAARARELYASDNDVEEMELDVLPEAPSGMLAYRVVMDAAGNVEYAFHMNAGFMNGDEWRPGDRVKKTVAFFMWARDKTHAVKIANERRIRLLEDEQWPND